MRLLRRKLALTGAAALALGGLALVLATVTIAYMLTGDSALAGGERTVALIVAGMLATYGVNHLWRRRATAEG